eukprot:COSAG02_NODE_61033_length_269_cov_1.223529_2_plen_58_part_01
MEQSSIAAPVLSELALRHRLFYAPQPLAVFGLQPQTRFVHRADAYPSHKSTQPKICSQ